jgi:hypothetical protein
MSDQYPNSGALFTPKPEKSGLYDGKLVGEGSLHVRIELSAAQIEAIKAGTLTYVDGHFFMDKILKDVRKDGTPIADPFHTVRLKQKREQMSVQPPPSPGTQHSMDTRPGPRPAQPAAQKLVDDEIPF